METMLKDRITRTRETLRSRIGSTTETLKARRERLRERAGAQVEDGWVRLALAEAAVLEGAANALVRARETLGERAAFTKRGEDALRDALVELRAGHLATLPIKDYGSLGVKQILPLLPALDLAELRTVRAYEARTKDRSTVLRDLDRRITQLQAS